jgi:hypothetical protein
MEGLWEWMLSAGDSEDGLGVSVSIDTCADTDAEADVVSCRRLPRIEMFDMEPVHRVVTEIRCASH